MALSSWVMPLTSGVCGSGFEKRPPFFGVGGFVAGACSAMVNVYIGSKTPFSYS